MERTKAFDCVEFKDSLQARLTKDYSGLSDEQIRKRIEEKLASSPHPVARLWRRLAERKGIVVKRA
jgi:hypothetical protein